MRKKNKFVRMLIAVLSAMIFSLMVLGGRLFTNIEEDTFVSEEEDRIVVGMSQLGSESGWRTPTRNPYRMSLHSKMVIS